MGRFKKEKRELSELEKVAQKIGNDWEDILKELETVDVTGLNKRIAQSNQAITEAKEELSQNEEYQKASETKKLLGSGLREVRKRQNAVIAVCVKLRQENGEV